MSDRVSSDTLTIEPLSAHDTELLVAALAESFGIEPLPWVTESSRGNPLFAEQLLAAIEEGHVGDVPRSLRGLLVMRFDQLGPGERGLLWSIHPNIKQAAT